MIESGLTAHSVWHGFGAGRHGRPTGIASTTITARRPLAMASLSARHGAANGLAQATLQAWGVTLPVTPHRVDTGELAFIWMGPERWLVTSEQGRELAPTLRTALPDLVYLTEQGDGRAVIRIAGPRARDALAKILPIDLHARAFGPNATALTLAAHIGVQIWRVGDADCFEVSVFRSLAADLLDWLVDASAEFGTDLIIESDAA